MTEAEFYDFVKRITPLVPMMPEELRDKVVPLVRDTLKKLAQAPGGGLPASARDEMVKAVPDKLMSEIVNDLRTVGQPGWVKDEPGQPIVRGTGWAKPVPQERSAAQTEIFDAMVSSMVGGPNSPVK